MVDIKTVEILNCGATVGDCSIPDGATAWASFICDMYWIDSVFLDSAADVVDSPELVTGNGLEIPDEVEGGAVEVLGTIAERLRECEGTFVFEFELYSTASPVGFIWMEQNTGETPISGFSLETWQLAVPPTKVFADEWDDTGGDTREMAALYEPALGVGIHKIAITRTNAKLAVSVDGGAVVTAITGTHGWGHGDRLDRVTIGGRWFDGAPDWSKGGFYYRAITHYPEQSDGALVTLSTV